MEAEEVKLNIKLARDFANASFVDKDLSNFILRILDNDGDNDVTDEQKLELINNYIK